MNELLHKKIAGTISKGAGRGREFGFPTANVSVDSDLLAGTYKVSLIVDGKVTPGLGPWFPDKKIFEVHLPDQQLDLYDQDVTIIPLHKIRDNKHFGSTDALISQIQADLDRRRKNPRRVMTFGTFDHLHPGHQSYLTQARQWGDELITVIALDQTVARLKRAAPEYTAQQRMEKLVESGWSDIVLLGDPVDHMRCLHDYEPHVICLGYDQQGIADKAIEYIQANNLPIHVVRAESFHPDQYKSSIIKKQKG